LLGVTAAVFCGNELIGALTQTSLTGFDPGISPVLWLVYPVVKRSMNWVTALCRQEIRREVHEIGIHLFLVLIPGGLTSGRFGGFLLARQATNGHAGRRSRIMIELLLASVAMLFW